MKSLWDDAEAARYHGLLGPRVYSSRLLGRDRSLVLHGGGNTSVKLVEKNLFGEDRIANLLRRDYGADVEVLCKTLVEAAEDFATDPLTDDTAILAVRRV